MNKQQANALLALIADLYLIISQPDPEPQPNPVRTNGREPVEVAG